MSSNERADDQASFQQSAPSSGVSNSGVNHLAHPESPRRSLASGKRYSARVGMVEIQKQTMPIKLRRPAAHTTLRPGVKSTEPSCPPRSRTARADDRWALVTDNDPHFNNSGLDEAKEDANPDMPSKLNLIPQATVSGPMKPSIRCLALFRLP